MCPQGAMMKDDPALGKTRDKNEPRLNAILRNFFGYFLLAVIVIFQPELRRMLAQLGSLPFVSTVPCPLINN